MDLSQMRALVRRDLKDEDSNNYRWTDGEIDRAIQRAVAEFSRYVPREMSTGVQTQPDSRELDISALSPRIRIERVEFPQGRSPKSYRRFAIFRDTLTLLGDVSGDGTDARVFWLAPHILDSQTSTIPPQFEDVVALGAAAYAVLSIAQYVTETAGIGGAQADADYLRWGQDMLDRFRRSLRAHARDNRARTSVLYTEND